MESRIGRWGRLIRRVLMISLLFMIYAGPAAAIRIDRAFDDEMFGESTPGEWALLVFIIWLFALPFGLAYAYWEDSPGTSAAWLSAFLGLVALFSMVGVPVVRMASALVVLPAQSLPSGWFDIPSSGDDVAFWIVRIFTIGILVGIPMVALIFQIIRMKHRSDSRSIVC